MASNGVIECRYTFLQEKRRKTQDGKRQENSDEMYYRVEDVPPWYATILFGFQQVMVCIGGVLTLPVLALNMMCGAGNVTARMMVISTTLVTTGFSTILQSTVGVRLPVLQGPSGAFIPPIIGLMNLTEFQCPTDPDSTLWMDRMVLVQGGLIIASLVQMTIGATGAIGLITKFIGPMTIAPLMILLMYSLVKVMIGYLLQHWVSVVLIALLLLFSLYLGNAKIPCCSWSKPKKRCAANWIPIFSLFPYCLAIGSTWALCVILTFTGVFNDSSDLPARVDGNNTAIIFDSPWIRFPYPGQWGMPQINSAIIVGTVAGTICSILESVGDYHACARVANEPPVPMHAVNRGILMEGFCCFIGGWLGGGLSVTTYSEIIGAIGITKVASRVTIQAAGVILILLGLFTKIGAVLATMPEPLFGGTLFLSMAMVMGVGTSSLRLADMSLSRNMAIVGVSTLTGILVPTVVTQKPIRTGIAGVDQGLTIFCTMELIVGGICGFVLDNTIPGATRRQRGLVHEEAESPSPGLKRHGVDSRLYDFPAPMTRVLDKIPCVHLLPFMPPKRNVNRFS